MASFQAEIGWKWMRNRENKNYHYVSFQPDVEQNIPKKQQKNKKNKKIALCILFKPKQV